MHQSSKPYKWVIPSSYSIVSQSKTNPLEFTNVKIIDMVPKKEPMPYFSNKMQGNLHAMKRRFRKCHKASMHMVVSPPLECASIQENMYLS